MRDSSFSRFGIQPNHGDGSFLHFGACPKPHATTPSHNPPQPNYTQQLFPVLCHAATLNATARFCILARAPNRALAAYKVSHFRSTVLAGCRTSTLCLTIRCRVYEQSTARFNDYECVTANRTASPRKQTLAANVHSAFSLPLRRIFMNNLPLASITMNASQQTTPLLLESKRSLRTYKARFRFRSAAFLRRNPTTLENSSKTLDKR